MKAALLTSIVLNILLSLSIMSIRRQKTKLETIKEKRKTKPLNDVQAAMHNKIASRYGEVVDANSFTEEDINVPAVSPRDINSPPKSGDPIKKHNAYGLRKWVAIKGFCQNESGNLNEDEYKHLIIDFCDSKGFNHSRSKGFYSYESFTQNRFLEFCDFAIDKFKKNQ